MYTNEYLCKIDRGFSLIELITVMILLGIISVALFSRLGAVSTAPVQAGRDDVIAALFFAQQQAMMRSTGNIRVVVTANAINVTQDNIPIKAAVGLEYYPLTMPRGVTLTPITFVFDKLGRTTAGNIVVTGTGNSSGVTANVRVEASGYAFAQ